MYMKYSPCEVVGNVIEIIEKTIEILKNINLNLDDLYKESSPKMRPKAKSSKLIPIMKDIKTTTLQTGN